MRRYYFDIREGAETFPDEEGVELSTIEKAQEEAASRSRIWPEMPFARKRATLDRRWRLRSGTITAQCSNSNSDSRSTGERSNAAN
jgi:hypothetical protein